MLLITLFGHVALWVMLFNRLHAIALPRPIIKASERIIALIVLGLGGAIVANWPLLARPTLLLRSLFGYEVLCWVATAWLLPTWTWQRFGSRQRVAVENHTEVIDVERRHRESSPGGTLVGDWPTRIAMAFPGNQLLQLHVQTKRVQLPSCPPEWNGLTIAHLSDLHFTGYVKREFFDFVVDETNRFDADLVAVTGDLIDKERCLPWIGETLGRLRGRHGVFFVLGNHDKRLRDIPALRRRLVEAGLRDLGGGQTELLTIRNRRLLLAGNERPWFRPLPELPAPDPDVFRLLLSHSPDQYPWAKQHGFQLMLAGHTHGGQIRFPWLGPIVTASWFGVRYASGFFYEPPTVLHVSRGISGVQTIRLNCPPELAKLVLS